MAVPALRKLPLAKVRRAVKRANPFVKVKLVRNKKILKTLQIVTRIKKRIATLDEHEAALPEASKKWKVSESDRQNRMNEIRDSITREKAEKQQSLHSFEEELRKMGYNGKKPAGQK